MKVASSPLTFLVRIPVIIIIIIIIVIINQLIFEVKEEIFFFLLLKFELSKKKPFKFGANDL